MWGQSWQGSKSWEFLWCHDWHWDWNELREWERWKQRKRWKGHGSTGSWVGRAVGSADRDRDDFWSTTNTSGCRTKRLGKRGEGGDGWEWGPVIDDEL